MPFTLPSTYQDAKIKVFQRLARVYLRIKLEHGGMKLTLNLRDAESVAKQLLACVEKAEKHNVFLG